MNRGKRPLTRKGRALRRLALAVGLVMLVHLAAESRLLPSWVKGIAEDKYATGPTRQVASLGAWEGQQVYLSAGEEAMLLYRASFAPWRLGWTLAEAQVLDLTEDKALHVQFYSIVTDVELLHEPPHTVTYRRCCFGRVETPAAGTFVLKSYVVQFLGQEMEPHAVEGTGEEMARFGRESCYYREGRTYFAYSFEEVRDHEGPGRGIWLEVYDTEGKLLCREWAGLA